jgi:hypothetical protein
MQANSRRATNAERRLAYGGGLRADALTAMAVSAPVIPEQSVM